jgi:predicted transglutaminase-like cysteine proteinase
MVTMPTDVAVLAEMRSLLDEVRRIRGDDPHREGAAQAVADALTAAVDSPALYAWLCERASEMGEGRADLEQPLQLAPGRGYQAPHDHGECWAVNVTLTGSARIRHYLREDTGGRVVLRMTEEFLCDEGKADCADINVAHEIMEINPRVNLSVSCHRQSTVTQNRYDLEQGTYKLIPRGAAQPLASGPVQVVGLA